MKNKGGRKNAIEVRKRDASENKKKKRKKEKAGPHIFQVNKSEK